MAVNLQDLPYPKDALEPYISSKTLEFHHGKHHNTYVVNVNNLINGSKYEKMDLEEIIKSSAQDTQSVPVFNNAAQCWNHSFYWQCIKPGGGAIPSGPIRIKIEQAFGSFEKFASEFKQAGVTQFGSGWAWLILDQDKLKIIKTANADTPLAHSKKALLTVDVWEHAYYLDYQNRRADYLDIYIEKLINWDFVNSQLV